MKQTAVEWLVENCHIVPKNELNKKDLIKQAKEMEEKQIIDACYFAYNEGCSYMTDGKTEFESFEQYYSKTFKNK